MLNVSFNVVAATSEQRLDYAFLEDIVQLNQPGKERGQQRHEG